MHMERDGRFSCSLGSGTARMGGLRLALTSCLTGHGADALEQRRARLVSEYEEWRAECSRWRSDVEVFDATIARATDDLRSLYIGAQGDEVISAGIPWYSTVFGRDSIITSLETLALNPRIAIDTLYVSRAIRARTENAYTEEQPGKIMHELRRGEMARSGEIPHVPYYGTIDATPLWLILLHETWRWTGDDSLVRTLLPNARRALEWIDRFGDIDGDGLVEYARTSDRGLVNQGWKDSGDGVPFPMGICQRRRSRSSRCRGTCMMPKSGWRLCSGMQASTSKRSDSSCRQSSCANVSSSSSGCRSSARSHSLSMERSGRCPR